MLPRYSRQETSPVFSEAGFQANNGALEIETVKYLPLKAGASHIALSGMQAFCVPVARSPVSFFCWIYCACQSKHVTIAKFLCFSHRTVHAPASQNLSSSSSHEIKIESAQRRHESEMQSWQVAAKKPPNSAQDAQSASQPIPTT